MCQHPFHSHMLYAIELASKAKWQTRPNPCVGAVLVKDGEIVSEGWHKGAGLAHAERNVLEDARQKNIDVSGCTLVVTLEPCRHEGRTPPCTQAILDSGIKHVVIGALDPNPEAGGGAAILSDNGVAVETGVANTECLDLIDDFVTWQTTEYPYTILKLAGTMDGRIATRTGHSKWISSEITRSNVHQLRQYMDAIIVGGNTFYRDDPQLTCRLGTTSNALRQPLAVVVTSRLPEATSAYNLITDRPKSTIFWTTVAAAASPKAEALRKIGIEVIGMPSMLRDTPTSGSGMRSALDLTDGFRHLRKEKGCYYTLCEGGGKLGLTLLEKGFAKELHLHLAPKLLGDNEATPLFDGRSPDTLDEALQLRITRTMPSGSDIMVMMKPVLTGETIGK